MTFWSTQTLINKNFNWGGGVLISIIKKKLSLPGDSVVKNPPAKQETWVQYLRWEHHLEKEMATHSTIPAGKSHGERSLAGCSPWGRKSQT